MSDITVNNFKAFYEQIRPYLGAVHSGFTPIGTVISVMGTTAPMNYLACDGTIYNISDYPELAAYFNQQFGSSNFFGGDGTTTFAVPDLRGEFLRGTGTNSHANQGSGANVGVHQDGTLHHKVIAWAGGGAIGQDPDSPMRDFEFASGTYYRISAGNAETAAGWGLFTSRPTNTSVLYCIASKNIFMDAGSNYSTEEQVVGTWIDGKPLYQRSYSVNSPANNSDTVIVTLDAGIDVKDIRGYLNDGNTCIACNYFGGTEWYSAVRKEGNYLRQVVKSGSGSAWLNKPEVITIMYTKTTD